MSIGKEFIEQTKAPHLAPSAQQQGQPAPPLELELDPTWLILDLPDPQDIDVDLTDITTAIHQRITRRKYADEPLTQEELAYLLWCSQGIKPQPGNQILRNVPSAGARHAFETFLILNQVEGLAPGLYRYVASSHKLALIRTANGQEMAEEAVSLCNNQPFVKTAAALFIWVAIPYRMTWRYSDRGYRYLYLDAGHICQNLYLTAESMDAGVCAIASFNDDACNRFLDLDGQSAFALYMATVGRRERA